MEGRIKEEEKKEEDVKREKNGRDRLLYSRHNGLTLLHKYTSMEC